MKPQTNGTHMPKPVYEEEDVTVLWNQAVHTDREVTANRPDIIIIGTFADDTAILTSHTNVLRASTTLQEYLHIFNPYATSVIYIWTTHS